MLLLRLVLGGTLRRNGQRKQTDSYYFKRGMICLATRLLKIKNRGVKLESSLDALSWYTGKIEISRYLEKLNKEKKVLPPLYYYPGDNYC